MAVSNDLHHDGRLSKDCEFEPFETESSFGVCCFGVKPVVL